MTETTAETGTALALFPKLNLPSVTGITEQMNKSFGTMYTRIEAGIAELPTDMSIAKNRDAVASYAYSISRTKTGLDEAASGVSSEAKAIVDAVNAERRQLKTTLDTLRDKARAPLDAWQEAEAKRERNVKDAIGSFQNIAIDHAGADSGELSMVLDNLYAWQFKEEHYGERIEDVKDAHKIAVERISEMLAAAGKREQEAAELEQLRAEKAAREQQEAERLNKRNYADNLIQHIKNAGMGFIDGISYPLAILIHELESKVVPELPACGEHAAEVDAIRVQNLSSLREALERQAEEGRRAAEEEAKAQAAREAQEAIDAEKRKTEEAEAARIAAEEARQRAEEKAEADRVAAKAAAEQEAQEREERAAQKVRDEQKAEAARIERERLAQERADQERAADEAHRRKINSAAVAAVMKAASITEAEAKSVIVAIYKGQIPQVTIAY